MFWDCLIDLINCNIHLGQSVQQLRFYGGGRQNSPSSHMKLMSLF